MESTRAHKIQVAGSPILFCLDLDCQHAWGKECLPTGILDAHAVVGNICENMCLFCTKKWHKQFLPVYCYGVVAFLEYLMQTGKIPKDVDYKSPILLLLAGSSFWKETVFEHVGGGIQNTGRCIVSFTNCINKYKLTTKQWMLAVEHQASLCICKQWIHRSNYWQPILQERWCMAGY